MLQYYDKQEAVNTGYRDFRRATLGIIAHAGFSKVMEWVPLTTAGASEGAGEGSYQKCLNILFEDFVWTSLRQVGFWVSDSPWPRTNAPSVLI